MRGGYKLVDFNGPGIYNAIVSNLGKRIVVHNLEVNGTILYDFTATIESGDTVSFVINLPDGSKKVSVSNTDVISFEDIESGSGKVLDYDNAQLITLGEYSGAWGITPNNDGMLFVSTKSLVRLFTVFKQPDKRLYNIGDSSSSSDAIAVGISFPVYSGERYYINDSMSVSPGHLPADQYNIILVPYKN